MIGKDAINPGCRAAAAAERRCDTERIVEPDFEPTPALGLNRLQQFGVEQIAHGHIGYSPHCLGLGGAFAQYRNQCLRALQQFLSLIASHFALSHFLVYLPRIRLVRAPGPIEPECRRWVNPT